MSVNYEEMDIDIQRAPRCGQPTNMQPTKANAKYYEGPDPKALDSVTKYQKHAVYEERMEEQAHMKEYHNSTWWVDFL